MKRILLITLALTVLLGVACKDPVAPEPTYYAASPVQCISYLEQAFNDRSISIFEKQLAPGFTFYFNQSDVGRDVGGYTIPSSWGYDHIRRAILNMVRPFAEGGAFDVSMQLPESDIGTPPEGATEYTASDIIFDLIIMIEESEGHIGGGYLDFTFEKANNGTNDYWRITDWRYFPRYGKGKGSWPLGEVLAYWYAINPLDPTE